MIILVSKMFLTAVLMCTHEGSRRAQYSLIKEYALNHITGPCIDSGTLLKLRGLGLFQIGGRCLELLTVSVSRVAGEVLVNPVLWHVAYTAEPSMKSLMQLGWRLCGTFCIVLVWVHKGPYV